MPKEREGWMDGLNNLVTEKKYFYAKHNEPYNAFCCNADLYNVTLTLFLIFPFFLYVYSREVQAYKF